MIRKAFQHVQYLLQPAGQAEAELVHGYWQMRNPEPTPCSFTVLPDGCCKLLLRRQPGQVPELLLCGLWTQAFDMTLPPQTTVLGVRFRLPAAEWLAPGPLPLNSICRLPLTASLGPDLLAAHDVADLARRVAAWATDRRVDPQPRALFAALYHQAGPHTVRELAAVTGWSTRHLNRYFQARFGVSLKTYVDVLRSYAAIQQLQPGDFYATGSYCDQSHGIRDVKKHTGATPRQLYRQRQERYVQLQEPESVNRDEVGRTLAGVEELGEGLLGSAQKTE